MLTITDEHLEFALNISSFFPAEEREMFLEQMKQQAPGLEKAWRKWGDETSRLYGPRLYSLGGISDYQVQMEIEQWWNSLMWEYDRKGPSDYQAGMEQWWTHSMRILGALFAANANQFPPVPIGLPEEIMKEWITSPQCPDWLLGKNLSDLHEEWAELFESNAEAFHFPHMGKVRIYALAEAFIRTCSKSNLAVEDSRGKDPPTEQEMPDVISGIEGFLRQTRQEK